MRHKDPVYLQQTPDSAWGWTEVVLSWTAQNVVWGFVPFVCALVVAFLVGHPVPSDEYRLGAVVLALTLCATQLVDNVGIPSSRQIHWKWARIGSNFVIAVGGGFSVLNAIHQYRPDTFNVDTAPFNVAAGILLLFALVVAFFGHSIKLALNKSYYEALSDETESLVADSAGMHDDGDITL